MFYTVLSDLMCKVSWLYDQCFLPQPGFIWWHGGMVAYTVMFYMVAWWHALHCTMFYIVACLRATPLDLSSKKQASRATWKQMINTPTFEISMWSIQRFWDHVKLKSVNRYSLSCIRTEATLYFGWSRGHNLLCCHIIFQFQYKIIICTICTICCVVTYFLSFSIKSLPTSPPSCVILP